MKLWKPIIILAALTLAACQQVSDKTGTTFAERCAGYRVAYAAAQALPQSDARDARLAVYKELLAACPPV